MKRFNIILLFILLSRSCLTSQTVYDWISVSSVNPNSSVYSLSEFQGKLITAGMFDSVGLMPASRIAAWDGVDWTSLGKGVRGGNSSYGTFIYGSRIYDNELYVWGDFDSAGTVAAPDIAKWNGTSWSAIGMGSDNSIYCTALYNNQLYAGGTFKNMDGSSASCIAVWDGNTWQAVGNNSLKGGYVHDLYEYQNELYAVGDIDSVNNVPCKYIARWNGTLWDTVAGGMNWMTPNQPASLNYPGFVLTEWNGKLLVGSTTSDIELPANTNFYAWDGTQWSLFSSSYYMSKIRKFYKYNNKLYSCGREHIGPQSRVWEWEPESGQWHSLGSGLYNTVMTLATYQGELYCGGLFNTRYGGRHNYISKWGNATSITIHHKNSPTINVFPNPVHTQLNVTYEDQITPEQISLTNALGQVVYSAKHFNTGEQIDVSMLAAGIYYLKIQTAAGQSVFKLVKE